MKTKIRIFTAVCLVAFVGVTSANASTNTDDKNLTSGNGTLNISGFNEAEVNEAVDYQKEAQLVTRWIADKAEAKTNRQIVERNESLAAETTGFTENGVCNDANREVTDFRKEAQLVTKAIADREEANALVKLVSEGKIVE